MSAGTDDNLTHIGKLDIHSSSEEIKQKSCDSGLNVVGLSTNSCSDSHSSDLQNVQCQNNVETLKSLTLENCSALESPKSISPDCNNTDDIVVSDSFTIVLGDDFYNKNEDCGTKLQLGVNDHKLNNCNDNSVKSTVNDVSTKELNGYIRKELEKSNLIASTLSLDEKPVDNKVFAATKSKSAEDISNSELTQQLVNSSSTELNTDKVITDFNVHKARLNTMHKINLDPANDTKYLRLPKEIVPQDLGNIVKNVHGIFSSVSGSLKNAYNSRVYLQKPITKPDVPITPNLNSQVMNEIFEDQHDYNNSSTESQNIVTRKIDDNTESAVNDKLASVLSGVNNDFSNLDKACKETSTVETSLPGMENLWKILAVLDKAMKNENVDPQVEILKLERESLERNLREQRQLNFQLQEKLKANVEKSLERENHLKELVPKVEMLNKRFEQAQREKDAAVMRYASVECAAIEARKAAELSAKAERAALAEVELLNNKLKSAHSEKNRICQLYDDKCHELSNSERECVKLREELREMEGRLKWTQSKLRMEMDAYKDSVERAEKLTQQVTELEAAKDMAITNAADSVRAKQLEVELKESQASLIMCRHEKSELEKKLSNTSQQLDTCTKERDDAVASLARTNAQVEELRANNLRLEEEAAELAALRAQAALADTLSSQLERERLLCAQAQAQADRERARAETCSRREASALEHAARVTAQHVAAAATAGDLHAKNQALTTDNESLRERLEEKTKEVERLRTALEEETERRTRENKTLARKVAELTEEISECNKKLDWEKGENGVLKKKHANAIKELNRELTRALKRCEQLEAKIPQPDAHSSRTGSVSSLSSGEIAPQEDKQNGHTDTLPDIQVREPDRQALIERIVSLQRAGARRLERCEFLEEHSRQLTVELGRKTRLLRHLLAELPAGALASAGLDRNKKEIARLGGGAMAAIWGGDPSGITPELSIEMNTKLQALLEDTLLKNITLKENIDTLGEEIARLKKEKQSATENK